MKQFYVLLNAAAGNGSCCNRWGKFNIHMKITKLFLLKKRITYKTSTIDLSIAGKKHIFEQIWFAAASSQPFYRGVGMGFPSFIRFIGLNMHRIVSRKRFMQEVDLKERDSNDFY